MTDRLDDIIARMQIREVIDKYAVYLDSGDFQNLPSVFSEDATYNIIPDPGILPLPLTGRKTICAALEDRYHEVQKTAQRRHLMTNVVIDDLTETSARSRTFLTVLSIPKSGKPAELRGTGIYVDGFVRIDNRWMISERVLHVDVLTGS